MKIVVIAKDIDPVRLKDKPVIMEDWIEFVERDKQMGWIDINATIMGMNPMTKKRTVKIPYYHSEHCAGWVRTTEIPDVKEYLANNGHLDFGGDSLFDDWKPVYFEYIGGAIYVKEPDEEAIEKIKETLMRL